MTMKTAIRAAAALLAIAASPMALAQTIAITGATLAIGDGSEENSFPRPKARKTNW